MAFFRAGQTEISSNEAYVYGVALIIVYVLKDVYMHNCFFYLGQLAIKMRVAICSLIYRKTLTLSQTSITEISSGRIVTLMSKDVHTLDMAIAYGNQLWLGLFLTTGMTFVVYRHVGVAAIAGVGFMIALCPIQRKYIILI